MNNDKLYAAIQLIKQDLVKKKEYFEEKTRILIIECEDTELLFDGTDRYEFEINQIEDMLELINFFYGWHNGGYIYG